MNLIHSNVNVCQRWEDSRLTSLLEVFPQPSASLFWCRSLSLGNFLLQILSPCQPQRMSLKLSKKREVVGKVNQGLKIFMQSITDFLQPDLISEISCSTVKFKLKMPPAIELYV